MRYLKIKGANGDIKLSKNALGTTYFGTSTDKKTCFALMDRFFELSGNCIDTARSYAEWLEGGESASEKVIGEWLESRRCREKTVLSTKGGFPHKDKKSRVTPKDIMEDIGLSLECLKTDYVDIYFLHRDDPSADLLEIMDTLSSLVRQGKVRAIGVSNWTAERIEKANKLAEENSLVPFSVSQIQWSAAYSTPELMGDKTLVCMNAVEYNWYLKNRLPVMAFSSQAKGIFSKLIEQGPDFLNQKIRDRFLSEKNLKRIDWVKTYCQRNNITPATAILAFLNCNRLPAASIIGCSSIAQLDDSMKGADYVMSLSDIEELSNI